jgi:hypothetical protein
MKVRDDLKPGTLSIFLLLFFYLMFFGFVDAAFAADLILVVVAAAQEKGAEMDEDFGITDWDSATNKGTARMNSSHFLSLSFWLSVCLSVCLFFFFFSDVKFVYFIFFLLVSFLYILFPHSIPLSFFFFLTC